MNGEFVAAMEDVLDLYGESYDPDRPVVCFDETSTQLLADTRTPLPAQPGRPRRQDYGYRRAGTRNIFLTCEPLLAGATWRSPSAVPCRTSLTKCSGWWMRPILTLRWYGWCSTI